MTMKGVVSMREPRLPPPPLAPAAIEKPPINISDVEMHAPAQAQAHIRQNNQAETGIYSTAGGGDDGVEDDDLYEPLPGRKPEDQGSRLQNEASASAKNDTVASKASNSAILIGQTAEDITLATLLQQIQSVHGRDIHKAVSSSAEGLHRSMNELQDQLSRLQVGMVEKQSTIDQIQTAIAEQQDIIKSLQKAVEEKQSVINERDREIVAIKEFEGQFDVFKKRMRV
ncbi:hypothetical protein HWV62_28870 [Athelia sp. TMB]|nr:hypothetical protein HWV62_28870 [Athelia sp. TMB]